MILSLLMKNILYCSLFWVAYTHCVCVWVFVYIVWVRQRDCQSSYVLLPISFFKMRISYMSTVFKPFLLLLPHSNSSHIKMYYMNQETSALSFETGSHCKVWLLIWIGWMAIEFQGCTLSPPPQHWDYKHTLPQIFLFTRVHTYAFIMCRIHSILLQGVCV